MNGITNATKALPKLYRAYIDDGQMLDDDWTEKTLTVTPRDNEDSATFTTHANGVTLKKGGLYVVSAGICIRGGGSNQAMVLAIRHNRNNSLVTIQNCRFNAYNWDSAGNETMLIHAQPNDTVTLGMNGTSTTAYTTYTPDESYFNVMFIG